MKKLLSTILLSVICLLSFAQEHSVNDTLYVKRGEYIGTPVRVVRYFKAQDSYEVQDITNGKRFYLNSEMFEFEADKEIEQQIQQQEGKSVVVKDVQNETKQNDKIKKAGEYLQQASSQMLLSYVVTAIGGIAGGTMMATMKDGAVAGGAVIGTGVLIGVLLNISASINIGNAGVSLSR
ncbi:MAG: hypothetical protein MJ197_08680 [Bacteroidales bacterium]|nr:hypothetical protein [Bacteroidales bacterium]